MSGAAAELRRRLRATSGRGRRLRGLAELLAPYRLRVSAMFASLVAATAAALAPAPLAKIAIDRGIDRTTPAPLYDRRRLPDLDGRLRDRHLRADLPGRMGRAADASGPAAEAVRASAGAVDLVLLANIAGVVISRMTNDVEALDQLVEDGLATLIQSSLTLLGVVVILLGSTSIWRC